MYIRKQSGFTLIELLIVIAIIGILSGIIIVSMSGATNAAKDSIRRQDIEQLGRAILSYGTLNGGVYPIQSSTCSVGSNCANLSSAMIPTYYSVFPRDPLSGYYTYYSLNGSDFTLSTILSNSKLYSYSPISGYYTSIIARSTQSSLYNGVNSVAGGGSATNVDDSANGSLSGYVSSFLNGWAGYAYMTSSKGFAPGTYDLYVRLRTDGLGNYPTSFNCAGVYNYTTSSIVFGNNMSGLTTSYQIKYFGRATINGTDNIYTYFSCNGATTNYYIDYIEFRPVS